jgi:putative MATE family efflux protein
VQVLLLGTLLSGVVGIAGAIFAPELLTLMGADAEVVAVGTGYARISLAGSATAFLLFLVNAVFRGAGDPAVAMRTLILGNGLNILLDPLLIFGLGPFPQLGIAGAAWATVIGRGIGFVWACRLLSQGSGHLRVERRHVAFAPAVMLNIARLSGWGTFQTAIGSLSWLGLVRVMATFGATAMAGYTIAIRIVLFAIMPAFGVGAAAATMVGQALGAKLPDRAEASVWFAARVNALLLGLVGVFFIAFAPMLVRWFTPDAAVAGIATYGLRAIALGYPLFGLGMVLEQSFNGAGDTRTPSWINFWVFWALQIPLAWYLAMHTAMQERGVFVAVSVAYSALAVVSAVLFRMGRWKEKHV